MTEVLRNYGGGFIPQSVKRKRPRLRREVVGAVFIAEVNCSVAIRTKNSKMGCGWRWSLPESECLDLSSTSTTRVLLDPSDIDEARILFRACRGHLRDDLPLCVTDGWMCCI